MTNALNDLVSFRFCPVPNLICPAVKKRRKKKRKETYKSSSRHLSRALVVSGWHKLRIGRNFRIQGLFCGAGRRLIGLFGGWVVPGGVVAVGGGGTKLELIWVCKVLLLFVFVFVFFLFSFSFSFSSFSFSSLPLVRQRSLASLNHISIY